MTVRAEPVLTVHEGHAQVCAMQTQRTGFQGPGTETPLPAIRPANHCTATSQPKASLSLKSPPRLSGADQVLGRRGAPLRRRRGRACGGQRSELQASSLASAPGTRSSQTNGSDLERGHSGHFRCPDSDSWVSSPGAGAVSPPHRLRARPKYSVHWKQLHFIEAYRGWTLPAGLRELYTSSDPLRT